MLTAIQKNVLAETLNVTMGVSANLLSEAVNQKVILSVPVVELKQGFEIHAASLMEEGVLGSGKLAIHMIAFGEECNGNVLVIFRQDSAGILANACKGNEPEYGQAFSNEDADVFREICNILLNSIAGELGNLLGVRLEYTAYAMKLSVELTDEERVMPPDAKVLVLYTSFFLARSLARGVMLIVLSAPSFEKFMKKLPILRDADV